jgi:RimJ/RimL family protein N-acetyltransferase
MGWYMKIITEPKELIGRYVASKQGRSADWGLFVAFGLVNDDEELIAGVVFNGYIAPNIMMHISADAITPGFISTVMHYAFVKNNCKRVTGIIDKRNKKSRRFAHHLGAKLEGVMRDAGEHGDICIYGLMKSDAEKWIQPRYMKKLEAIWAA